MASHGICYMMSHKRLSGLPVVGSVVDTYGADTANTKGATLTAPNDASWGSWVAFSTSCQRIKALVIAVGHGQADFTLMSDQWHQISIGVGASGSEVEIAFFNEAGGTSANTKTPHPLFLGPIYIDVPAGSRLSARVKKQAGSLQRTLDLVLYGIR